MTRLGGVNQGRTWLHLSLAGSAFVAIGLLAGCASKPEPAPEPTPKVTAKQAPKSARERVASQRMESNAPPPPAPSPTPHPDIVVVKATDMATDVGRPDGEGGVVLGANGFLQKTDVKIPYITAQVLIEMKGRAAHQVWPEVEIVMENKETKKGYWPFDRDQCASPDYTVYRVPLKKEIPAGTYTITYRYYNNQDFPETHEDRAAWLKSIEFRPQWAFERD